MYEDEEVELTEEELFELKMQKMERDAKREAMRVYRAGYQNVVMWRTRDRRWDPKYTYAGKSYLPPDWAGTPSSYGRLTPSEWFYSVCMAIFYFLNELTYRGILGRVLGLFGKEDTDGSIAEGIKEVFNMIMLVFAMGAICWALFISKLDDQAIIDKVEKARDEQIMKDYEHAEKMKLVDQVNRSALVAVEQVHEQTIKEQKEVEEVITTVKKKIKTVKASTTPKAEKKTQIAKIQIDSMWEQFCKSQPAQCANNSGV